MTDEVAEQHKPDTPEGVLALLREDTGRGGYQRALDEHHVVTHVARGPQLLVTFESLEHATAMAQSGPPVGLDFVEDKNWSLLHIAARSDTWFRAQPVYDFFDALVDDCFFEEFDRVTFYGSGMGGYGACAFAVAAPGANVLAISPQATLDTELAGWDTRFPKAKRLNFTDRYGYAPDMVEGANSVFVLFDPYRPLDHVHASLFRGPNVNRLKCRHLDGLVELALREMDLLHAVVQGVGDGSLRPVDFYAMLRKRRRHARYLRTLLHALGRRNQPMRVALLCKYVLEQKRGGPFFRKSLAAARDVLARRGPLPDWLAAEDLDDVPRAPSRKTF